MGYLTIVYFFVKLLIIIALIVGIVMIAVGYAIETILSEIEDVVSDPLGLIGIDFFNDKPLENNNHNYDYYVSQF